MDHDPNKDHTPKVPTRTLSPEAESMSEGVGEDPLPDPRPSSPLEDPSSHHLARAMGQFGEMMQMTSSITTTLIYSLEMLVTSLQDFNKVHIKEAMDCKKMMDKAAHDFETSLNKVLSRKVKVPGQPTRASKPKADKELLKRLAEEEELKAHRRDFEIHRFDYVTSLNRIRGIRRLEMVETTCACVYSFNTFFHAGIDVAKGIKRTIDDLHVGIQAQKRIFLERNDNEDERAKLLEAVSHEDGPIPMRQVFPDTLRSSVAISRRGKDVHIAKEVNATAAASCRFFIALLLDCLRDTSTLRCPLSSGLSAKEE